MVSSWRHRGTLQCRNNRNSHLPWVPLHSPNPLLLLRHLSPVHPPHLPNLDIERSSLKRSSPVRRCHHRHHHLFLLSLRRPLKQLHLLSQLRLHRHPSPRKGRPQRSRSPNPVVRCLQKPTALKHLHPPSLRLQRLRRLRKQEVVRRGLAMMRLRGLRQAPLRHHLRRG